MGVTASQQKLDSSNTIIQHAGENMSNAVREIIDTREPKSLRTYTPSLAVFARSAGIFHFTPEDRRLYDYASGVLVANLGHNPRPWINRFCDHLGWTDQLASQGAAYVAAVPLTSYNAITEIEAEASDRLVQLMQSRPGGRHMEQVMWAASGSEAVQKALWAALHREKSRDIILATRDGFHGKKGLAGAVTGNEQSADRDPRVKFISFPKSECMDVDQAAESFDPTPYERELHQLYEKFGRRINALITEPYLGGGGSFHPPAEYLHVLQSFCQEHDIVLILDEVQANFGRTGSWFAYETYGIQPDVVILGKGLGNGGPVAAAVGPKLLFDSLSYGEASDTYSANPIACAAVLATLDLFESNDIIGHSRLISERTKAGLLRLKELPCVRHIRGEGVVWGVEIQGHGDYTPNQIANEIIKACYLGEPGGDGIFLLGALADCVLRVSPPLVISPQELDTSMDLFYRIIAEKVAPLCS